MLTLFGLSVFVFLVGGMLWVDSRRWRTLAAAYAGQPGRTIEQRRWQSVVLFGFRGYNSLNGITQIGLHQAGVSFRVTPPFSLFHSPLLIPYEDISGWKTTWYLDSPSVELEFRRAPEVKMVVGAEQAEWIRRHSGHKMTLHSVTPPQGKAGQGWRALILVHLGAVLVMLALAAIRLSSR